MVNILGLEIAVGNESILYIGFIAIAVMFAVSLYVLMDVNAKYPKVNFRVNENGILRTRLYRLLSGRIIVRDQILNLLFNRAQIVGDDITRFTFQNIVGTDGKLKKFYLANDAGNQIIPIYEEAAPKEAISGKQIGSRYVKVMRDSKELTEQADPLKSEFIKLLPTIVLFFALGLIIIAIYNTAMATYTEVAKINADTAAINLKTVQIQERLLTKMGVNTTASGG